jgi:hypothetical protein
MVFQHLDRVKRRTNVPDLYIYGYYLGTVHDFNGVPMCVCANPDITQCFFFARPDDLLPLEHDTPPGKRQSTLVHSKY